VELLDRSGVQLRGAKVCVVGRSNMVGVPLALLLMQRDATVTVVHSKTVDPPAVCREADVVIVAVGKPELVNGHWLKEGAVVIDVGINSVPDKRPIPKKATSLINRTPTTPAAKPSSGPRMRLVGDVEFTSAFAKASMITPVPGGVGPMTIAMLLRNTLQAARRFANARADQAPGWAPTSSSSVESSPTTAVPQQPSSQVQAGTSTPEVMATTTTIENGPSTDAPDSSPEAVATTNEDKPATGAPQDVAFEPDQAPV